MSFKKACVFTLSCLALLPGNAMAEYAPPAGEKRELSTAERLDLAKQFVTKISKGLNEFNSTAELSDEESTGGLPEGEDLLFRLQLKGRLDTQNPFIPLDGVLLGRVENNQILISFRDLISTLEFPIDYNTQTGTAEGWYIRQNKSFIMNTKSREVKADGRAFKFSDKVQVTEDDIFAPAKEIAQWFDFTILTNARFLQMTVESQTPLPVQEAYLRRGRTKYSDRQSPPSLPTKESEQKLIDFPFVDVSTSTRYERPGDGGDATNSQTGSVRTSGDFLHGNLATQTQFDREEKIRSLRATYSKESLEPELLGPIKARRFELGDVNAVVSPLQQNSSTGIGARVTNADPRKSYLQPSTEVTGTYFPDWDVELYRDNQLLDFQTIGDDGQYRFENVDLYSSGNNFRLVFYGPQGEIKEEDFVVPVNARRLSDTGASYDVSVAAQELHAYDKLDNDDKDKGAPLISATYEKPVGEESAATIGFEAGQMFDEQRAAAHAGFATTFGDTLMNFDAAIDSKSEMAAQVVARRDLGRHLLRNELRVSTDNYVPEDTSRSNFGSQTAVANEVLRNQFNINGPSPIDIGKYGRYNLGLDYIQTAQGKQDLDAIVGMYTSWDRLSLGQNFLYGISNEEDDEIRSQTTFSGSLGQNRLRLVSEYEIKPENQWESVVASLQRRLTQDLDIDFSVEREMDPALTTASTRLDWDAGFANISPSLSYNTDKDVIAMLNTRFGLVRDPQERIYKSYERQFSNNGAVSAFVFLDKDGNSVYDGDDEVIPDVIIHAPQNGGSETTNEEGVALFKSMTRMKLTDVFVDGDTLPDPFWIPSYQGASILPREGHIATIQFPVVVGGEMDGTVYARDANGTSHPLRSMSLSLYKPTGEKVMSVSSESDGFFLFNKIPPGTYYLTVDDRDFVKGYARPLPQKVTIGYDGTTIYGNNIYFNGGASDVPIQVLAAADITEENAKKFEGKNFALNLGSYKSQLMMGLTWFKVKSFYRGLLGDNDLASLPSQSYPDKDSGRYVLRVALKGNDLQTAYKTCQDIAKKGQACSLEILPGGFGGEVVKQAAADL